MAAPTKRAFLKWEDTDGVDFLQLSSPSGQVLSWIDSTGAGQGALAASAGGSGPLLSSFTTVSSSQLLNIGPTPVQLIPAPGAGLAIFPTNIYARYVFGTVAYVSSGGSMSFKIGSAQISALTWNTFINVASGNRGNLNPLGALGVQTVAAAGNLPLMVTNNSTALTSGDGYVEITVLYQVLPL